MDTNEFVILINHLLDKIKKLEKRIDSLEANVDAGKY